jgi:NAD(P)-dependent dehydrogenase (short-subunit alcohol dehydrogenase family)
MELVGNTALVRSASTGIGAATARAPAAREARVARFTELLMARTGAWRDG